MEHLIDDLMVRGSADHEPAVAIEAPVRDNDVQVRVETLKIAEGLHRHRRTGYGIILASKFHKARNFFT